jgi:WD40 repeat protein
MRTRVVRPSWIRPWLALSALLAAPGWYGSAWAAESESSTPVSPQQHVATAMRLALESRTVLESDPRRGLLLAADAAELARRATGRVPALIEETLRFALSRTGGRVLSTPPYELGEMPAVLIDEEPQPLEEEGEAAPTPVFDGATQIPTPIPDRQTVAPQPFDESDEEQAPSRRGPSRRGVKHPFGKALGYVEDESPAPPMFRRLDRIATDRLGRWVVACNSQPEYHPAMLQPENPKVFVWDLSDPAADSRPRELPGGADLINVLAVSADGEWLAVGGSDGDLRLWRLGAELSDQPALLLQADGAIVVPEVADEQVLSIPNEEDIVQATGAQFSPDGRLLAVAWTSGQVQLWKMIPSGPAADPIPLFTEAIPLPRPALVFSENGTWLAVANSDPGAGFGQLVGQAIGQAIGQALGAIFGSGHAEDQAAREATELKMREAARKVHLFRLDIEDIPAGRHEVETADGPVAHVVLSTLGNRLAACDTAGRMYAWELDDGGPTETRHRLDHTGQDFFGGLSVKGITLDPRGLWLLSAGYRDTRLWHLAGEAGIVQATTRVDDLAATDQFVVDPRGDWFALANVSMHAIRLHDFSMLRALHSDDREWLVVEPNTAVFESLTDMGAMLPTGSGRAGQEHFVGPTAPAITLAASAGGHHLLSSAVDGTVRLWEANRVSPFAQPRGWAIPGMIVGPNVTVEDLAAGQSPDYAASFELDPNLSGPSEGTLRVWQFPVNDVQKPLVELRMAGPLEILAGISRNRKWLVTRDLEGETLLWHVDGPGGEPVSRPVDENGEGVGVLAFSLDSRWLATARGPVFGNVDAPLGPDSDANGNEDADVDDETAADVDLGGMPPSPAPPDPRVRLWNLAEAESGRDPIILEGHTRDVTDLWFSGDNRWLVTFAGEASQIGGTGGEFGEPSDLGHLLCLWDLTSVAQRPTPQVLLADQRIRVVRMSPRQRILVACDAEGGVHIWNLASPSPADSHRVLEGHRSPVRTVAFGRGDTLLATGSEAEYSDGGEYEHGTVRVWNLAARVPERNNVELQGHRGSIRSMAISQNGKWVVTVDWQQDVFPAMGRARLWNLAAESAETAGRLLTAHHDSEIVHAAISPDSRWLVTVGSADLPLMLWDLESPDPAETGVALIRRRIPADLMSLVVRFTEDNRSVQVLGVDGVRTWSLDLDELISLARRTARGEN